MKVAWHQAKITTEGGLAALAIQPSGPQEAEAQDYRNASIMQLSDWHYWVISLSASSLQSRLLASQ